MLSFQKADESTLDNLTNPQAKEPQQNNDQAESPEKFMTVTDKAKQVNKTTKLLAILSVVGLMGLWFMVKSAAPEAAQASEQSTEQMRIELAIAQLTGQQEGSAEVENILDQFTSLSTVEQVGVEELVKNPFTLDGSSGQVGDEQPSSPGRSIRADQFQLITIMSSPAGNSCMVNDRLLYKGDTIDGLTVSKIGNDYVQLTSNNNTVYTLKLDE